MSIAYQVVCLSQQGGIMRMVVTHCDGDGEAIRKGFAECPDDCAALEITTAFNEHVVWRGTREEARAQASRAGAAAETAKERAGAN